MTVQVGKLAVHTTHRGARGDVGFRMRAEAFLRSLDLEPTGLPDRAVLVVRRMELGPGGAAQQGRAALAEFRRDAARPAAGPVPASAKAVLFEDEAELLTCFTADVVRGVASRWYWQQISSRLEVDRGVALAAAWMRDVRWLPGSLARLSGPAARNAVALLSPPQAARVLRALLAAFGIVELPLTPVPSSTTALLVLPASPGTPATAAHQGPAVVPPLPDPPWRGLLQATSLHPDAEALLGVALSLHHFSALVRRPAYAERLANWRAAAGNAHGRYAPAGSGSPPTAISAPARGSQAEDGPREPVGSTGVLADSSTGQPGSASQPAIRTLTQSQPMPLADGTPADEPMTAPPGTPPISAPGHSLASTLVTDESSAEPHRENEVPETRISEWAGEGIITGLASLLFLVNFVVWLEDDEETVMPTGWALVDLLGRYLLGDQLSDFADDPIWDMLAELDGRRPGTPPALELGDAHPLRVPQAWLRRWSPDARYVASRDRPRPVIRHCDVGFVAADVPFVAGRLDEVRAAEADKLAGVEIIVEDQPNDAAPAAEQRFGAVVGAYVRWLLHSKGIGVSSLISPGRVQVTGTHVDVLLNLEDVDLPVRVAGLDRDPGWVPALGRIVLFHFLAAR